MVEKKYPLMRKGTAVWLVDNTALTFEQIAEFCGLHILEIQGIADGDVAGGIIGQDPIANGQLDKEEIKRCEADTNTEIRLKDSVAREVKVKKKTAKYTPIARRADKPEGIYFILKYYPEMADAKIRKLIGTTSAMIESIRNRTHWNIKNLKPKDPVLLGICTQAQLNDAIDSIEAERQKAEAIAEKAKKALAKKREAAKAKREEAKAAAEKEAKEKAEVKEAKKSTVAKEVVAKKTVKKLETKSVTKETVTKKKTESKAKKATATKKKTTTKKSEK